MTTAIITISMASIKYAMRKYLMNPLTLNPMSYLMNELIRIDRECKICGKINLPDGYKAIDGKTIRVNSNLQLDCQLIGNKQ